MRQRQSVFLGELTRREFRQGMKDLCFKVAILPLAATEQHLEHLAMEHDWRSVVAVAKQVAEKLQPQVLVADALKVGISEHHMKHPGTLTLQPGTFLAVLSDLIDSLCRAGFEHVLVLNGHGGNVQPVQAVWDQFLRKFQINLQFLSYWDVLTEADARELLRSGSRMPEDLPGHAQEFETAMALHLFPENVRNDVIETQGDRTPSLALPETGQVFYTRIVERLCVVMRDMINGKRIADVPSFHP